MMKRYAGWLVVAVALVLAGSLGSASAANLGDVGGVNVKLTPYGEVGGSWDSNPFLVETGEEDLFFAELEAGADLALTGRMLSIQLGGYINERLYSKDVPSDLEDPSFGERFTVLAGDRDTARIRLYQSYQDVTDYSRMIQGDLTMADTDTSLVSEDRSDRTRRTLMDVAFNVGRDITDKTMADLSYAFHAVDYDSEVLYDTTRQNVGAQFGWLATSKGAAIAYGEYGIESSDSYADDAGWFTVQVGYMTRASDKVNARCAVGVQSYDSTTLVARDGSSSGDLGRQTGFSASLAGTWKVTDRLSLAALADRGMAAASIEPNVREITRVGIAANQAIASKIGVSAGCSYRYDDYLLANTSGQERNVNAVGVNAAVNYRPYTWARFFVAASYEDSNSNLEGEDYAQTRVTVGSHFEY